MLSKALNYLSAIFAALWMVIIFAEYWVYNPNYSKSFELFQYLDLLVIFILLGAGLTWYFYRKKKKSIPIINGITIFSGLLIVDIIAVSRFYSTVKGIELDTSGLFAHFSHIIGVSICLFLVYLFIRVLGSIFNMILPLKIPNQDASIIQAAIGILILVSIMFLFGLIGLLNGFVLIPICLLILAFYWRQTYKIAKETLLKRIEFGSSLNAIGIFSFLFLGVFLMLNYVQVLRPFPLGSDSLRVYVNLPSLIAEYGALVDGNQPYNWSLFMSIGLVVFGRVDVVLGLSFLGGLLSLQALYRLARKWLDPNYSAFVLLLFYSLPMVSFLSYMDMKIDMGLMYMTLSVLLLFYNWFKSDTSDKFTTEIKGPGLLTAKTFFKSRIPSLLKENRLLVLIGLLSGFAFGIKLTSLFFLLALLSSIWYLKGNKLTFVTSFVLCLAAVFLLKLDAQPALRQFHEDVFILEWGLLISGVGLLGYLFLKQKQRLIKLLTYSLIVGSFFVLPNLPWMGKNLSETGKVNITSLLYGKKASPEFKLDYAKIRATKGDIIIPGLYQMPTVEAPVNNKKNKNKNQKTRSKKAVSVDLHRFMGYEVLPARYLSLPYDVFIKTNISGFFSDIGFILLLLLPILYLFKRRNESDWTDVVARLSFIVLSSLMLFISIPSAFMNKNGLANSKGALNLLDARDPEGVLSSISHVTHRAFLELYGPVNDWFISMISKGDNITYPLLLLLFIGILLLAFNRIKGHSKITQSFVLFLSMYFFLWWILGSGAPWYGLLLFSLPFIFLMKNISPQNEKRDENYRGWTWSLKKYVVLSAGILWVLLAFMYRSTNYEPTNESRAELLYYPAILEYQMGNYNKNKVMDYHFPNVRQLVAPINRDRKSKVYMVGSPYKYFIDKNDSRVLSDIYLDFFNGMIKQYETKENIIKALKESGFKYIIFDLNMMTYDVTPDKSLTSRFTQFMNALYRNHGVELMATDRKIKLNSNGEEIFGVFQDKGTITRSGTVAIFEIK